MNALSLSRNICTLFLLLCFTLPASHAQNGEGITPVMDSLQLQDLLDSSKNYQTLFEQFYGSDIVQLKIEGDISEMIRLKRTEKDVDAELTWTKADQSTEKFSIEIEARGKSRKKICSFPPIKLKFKSKKLKKRGLVPAFKNLKLVTHCFESGKGDRGILKEYLVYKMYNAISDASFRVQLARIEYVDTGKRGYKASHLAFLIEGKDELAYRHQGKISESYNFQCKELDKEAYCRMLVFQYMIGNQDWRVKFLHNIKLIKLFDAAIYVPVPYDFDYSGLVNNAYAISNPDLPTSSHIQRFFMGDSSHAPEEMKTTLQLFRDRREQILLICEEEKLLDKKDRKYMRRYLKSFFKGIKNDRVAATNMPPWDW